jgi:hypothetical protein
MPMFITIGYGDSAGYEHTPEPLRAAAHAHDAKLRAEGVRMGRSHSPVQVRNTLGARVETTNGPYMTSVLPVAGFAIIEASDMAEAIKKVSEVPCAIAHGVVEVWPLE